MDILSHRMTLEKRFERFIAGLSLLGRTVLAGLVVGVLSGISIQFWLDKMAGIGLLYGGPRSPILGWIVHLFHSVVGALVFMAIITRKPIERYLTKLSYNMLCGLIYGFLLWTMTTVVLLPIWFGLMVPWPGGPLRNFTIVELFGSLVGFSLYGLILGGSVGIHLWKDVKHNSESALFS